MSLLNEIEMIEAEISAANLKLVRLFKRLNLQELRKQAQIRGVLEVEDKDCDQLVEAIFERRGERAKQTAYYCGN